AIRAAQKTDEPTVVIDEALKKALDNAEFAHLHNHSQFSVLQSTISIPALVAAAAKAEMPVVAVLDHSNMMRPFHLVNTALRYNMETNAIDPAAFAQGNPHVRRPLEPFVCCDFYVRQEGKDNSRKDNGYLIVFFAKQL